MCCRSIRGVNPNDGVSLIYQPSTAQASPLQECGYEALIASVPTGGVGEGHPVCLVAGLYRRPAVGRRRDGRRVAQPVLRKLLAVLTVAAGPMGVLPRKAATPY